MTRRDVLSAESADDFDRMAVEFDRVVGTVPGRVSSVCGQRELADLQHGAVLRLASGRDQAGSRFVRRERRIDVAAAYRRFEQPWFVTV